jgi:hypothetical protein
VAGTHPVRISGLAIVAFLLCAAGFALTYLKVDRLKLPLSPGTETSVWTAEVRIRFTGRAGPAKVTLRLPREPRNFTVLDEDFVSRGFGLRVDDEPGSPRQAAWTIRRSQGEQALYYRLKAFVEPRQALETRDPDVVPDYPAIPAYPEPLGSAIDAVLTRARSESADIFSFASRLLALLAQTDDENVKVIHASRRAADWVDLVIEILAGARIPARAVYGLSLDQDFVDRGLIAWLEVHNGERWRGFDPQSGRQGYPVNFLTWSRGEGDVVDATGVRNLQVSFSAVKSDIAQVQLSKDIETRFDTGLRNLTLFNLPVTTQGVYRILLMIPLGALIIAFMRVVVGIPTFGTFMPILIALAFRETHVGWGIALFLVIVSLGFLLRVALAGLRLLLVPRLAGMLVIVIILMLVMSLLSAKLGFEQGLSVALFPMVILTMTIERMSIVWEERGMGEAAKECAGSLVVAVCGYYVMTNTQLQHVMFFFPELLLVVLAACLLLGAYTGYRLSEVLRFKDLAKG